MSFFYTCGRFIFKRASHLFKYWLVGGGGGLKPPYVCSINLIQLYVCFCSTSHLKDLSVDNIFDNAAKTLRLNRMKPQEKKPMSEFLKNVIKRRQENQYEMKRFVNKSFLFL